MTRYCDLALWHSDPLTTKPLSFIPPPTYLLQVFQMFWVHQSYITFHVISLWHPTQNWPILIMDPSFFQFFQVFQFQRPFHYYILKFRYQTTQCPSPFLGFSLIPFLSFSEIFIFLNILQYFKCWSKGQVTRSGHKARSQGQVTKPVCNVKNKYAHFLLALSLTFFYIF